MSVEQKLMMKLRNCLCLECTRLTLSLSRWLIHSTTYLFLSIILSRISRSLFSCLTSVRGHVYAIVEHLLENPFENVSPVGEFLSKEVLRQHAPHTPIPVRRWPL